MRRLAETKKSRAWPCEKFDGCDKNGQIEMRPGALGVIQNEVTGAHQYRAALLISHYSIVSNRV